MKKFLILTVLLVAFALPVSAEQPAAEQYRQMFASGNFYVEYEVADKSGHWVIPESISSSTVRHLGMVRDQKKHRNEVRAGRNGQRVAKLGVKDKYPKALYQNGKYYKFIVEEKPAFSPGLMGEPRIKILRRAILLDENELYSPTLDPDEHWETVRKDLSLPEAFRVLFPNDPMNDDAQISPKPTFNGESKRTIDNKEYDCDQYINDIKSLSGAVIALEAYNMLYDGGKLVRIQKYLVRDGKELLVNDFIVKEISAQVPDETFYIGKFRGRKFKFYAARKGDMNDLLDKLEEIGEIGGVAQ